LIRKPGHFVHRAPLLAQPYPTIAPKRCSPCGSKLIICTHTLARRHKLHLQAYSNRVHELGLGMRIVRPSLTYLTLIRVCVATDPDACSRCDRLRVSYFVNSMPDGRKGLVGSAWFGLGTEGAPGHTHGTAATLSRAPATRICAHMNRHTHTHNNLNAPHALALILLRSFLRWEPGGSSRRGYGRRGRFLSALCHRTPLRPRQCTQYNTGYVPR